MGGFSTWLPEELIEHLEHNFGKVTIVQQTETEIRYTYKRGKKGGKREGKILVTFNHLWDQKLERVNKPCPLLDSDKTAVAFLLELTVQFS